MKSGLIGMGNMGIHFGANPLAAGADLTVFDVSAPVSGGTTRAKIGTWTIMASGDRTAFDKARSTVDIIRGAIFHLGEASRPRWSTLKAGQLCLREQPYYDRPGTVNPRSAPKI